MRLLLKAGAHPNAADSDGETSLHYAASYCQLDIMRLLLKAGAHPNAADSDGETSLYHAANCGHPGQLDIMRLLLEAGADPNAANSYRQTALYYPACCGRLETARLLLEAGADPNVAENRSGETPLVNVARSGYEAMMQMLLSHGAEANAVDCYGRTSLYYAACVSQGDIMYLLLDGYDGPEEKERMTESICTIKRIRTEMITDLLKHGADPNLVDRNKRTPLAIIGSKAEVRSPDISECVSDEELPEAVESVVHNNIDYLFGAPQLSAVAYHRRPKTFHSSVMVVEPTAAHNTFKKLQKLARNCEDLFDFSSCADQILNRHFKRWHKLPPIYCSEVSSSFAYVPPGGDANTISPEIRVA
ncbi:PREDICTED: ankyrin-1-like [Priapulus caudatus]|uniref:Ankyrin-1-like n=1 Tax=Priapulus caudatus TaxID=37621 RepID=A0ABM1F7R2_PRICU|nr:PREDICTED: ankyrin-1-like [Priapulus caudatus]